VPSRAPYRIPNIWSFCAHPHCL